MIAGAAFAQDTGTSAGTSTASTTLSLGQQISAINRGAQNQIRALQQELESKIKALQDEYAQKIRDVRTNAQDQVKVLQGSTTMREGVENRTEEEGGKPEREINRSPNAGENRGRVMDFFFRLFRRGGSE